eukprot:gene1559-943_t
MSWVRLESTNGLRMSAPSYSPPPVLEGFDKLFQPPIQLRRLHSFTHLTNAAGWGEEAEEEEVTVLLEGMELGGRVGGVCIAVGGSSTTIPALEVLQDCVVALLKSTSENGLQLVLDALCTRAPPRVDLAPRLLEGDGLSGTTIEKASESEALLSSDARAMTAAEKSKANRSFLRNIREDYQRAIEPRGLNAKTAALTITSAAEEEDDEKARRESSTYRAMLLANLVPATSVAGGGAASPAALSTANFFAKVLTRGIHFARRQVLLYFLKLDTVPISVLSTRLSIQQEVAIYLPRTGGSSDLTTLIGQPALKVHSTLRRSEKLQAKSHRTALWREATERAEEIGQMLILAIQRTLCGAFPFHADLFGKEMWGKTHRSTVHTPLFAAFSTSGLLFGSGTFYHVLDHRQRFLLATVAINALACAPLSRPYTFTSTSSSAEKKLLNWAVQVVQLPLIVNTPLAGVDTLDLCIFSIGDALSLVIGISRTVQQQRGISMATVVDQLKKGIRAGPRVGTAVPPPLGPHYFHSLAYHLHTLCHHNLSPTQEFYASVCALSVLENGLFFDNKAEEIGVAQGLKETLASAGAQYYGEGVVFDDGEDPNLPPPLFTGGQPDSQVVDDKDVGCVCCLPFCSKKKPEAVEQDAFAAARVKMAKTKLKKAKAKYNHKDTGAESPPPEVLSFNRRVLMLTLPLHAMWYLVAAHVAVAELLAFRSLEGSAVHSAYWVQRSVNPLHHDSPSPSPAARRSTTSQYCVGFFRPCVQASYRYRLAAEEDGAALCLQDPSVSLDLALQPSREVGRTMAEDSQVTVFPLSAMEVPVPSPLHVVPLPEIASGRTIGGESIIDVEEDEATEAALVTSIYLASEEKLRLKKHKRFGRAVQDPSMAQRRQEEDDDSADVVLAGMANQTVSPAAAAAAAAAEKKLTSTFLRIEEVINLEENVLGEEWNVVRSLEKRRPPKAFSDRREPDLFDDPKASVSLRELCEALAVCKEAAVTLFNGALGKDGTKCSTVGACSGGATAVRCVDSAAGSSFSPSSYVWSFSLYALHINSRSSATHLLRFISSPTAYRKGVHHSVYSRVFRRTVTTWSYETTSTTTSATYPTNVFPYRHTHTFSFALVFTQNTSEIISGVQLI